MGKAEITEKWTTGTMDLRIVREATGSREIQYRCINDLNEEVWESLFRTWAESTTNHSKAGNDFLNWVESSIDSDEVIE